MVARQMVNFVYMIGDRETGEAVVVDPAYDVTALLEYLEADGMRCTGVLATHHHPDHVGGSMMGYDIIGVSDLLEAVSVPVHAQADEAELIARVTGLGAGDIVEHTSGDIVTVGAIPIELIHTPGHTPGSQCFRVKNTLISGDTLFINGCGRVDLPGSNSEDMYHSMCKLCSLPDDTLLLPGHNYGHVPNATIGETKQMNTYLRIDDIDTWKTIMGG